MYISFHKTIAKFGGFRFGVGFRTSKKNSGLAFFLLLFVGMFKLMWYMMIITFWLLYAMCYGMYWCIKKIANSFKRRKETPTNNHYPKTTTEMPLPGKQTAQKNQ